MMTLCLWLVACQSDSDVCTDTLDLSKINVEVKITRLEQEIFRLKTKAEINAFLDKYPDFAEKFMLRNRLPHDSIAADQIYTMITEPHQDTLYQDVQKKFANLTSLKKEFEDAFTHIKYYYPQFKVPKIYTVMTGQGSFFGTDLFVSDAFIVISLDFFIGKDNRYRPPIEMMPDYIWRRYHPAAIVPSCVQYLSNAYNKTDITDKTALAEMVYHGKTYQFMRQIMPCLPDSILTGYTSLEINSLSDAKNRDFIWNHLIEQQVLFNTNQRTISKYLEERPSTPEIHAKTPGRIGRWLGWRIVQKYMQKKTEITLQNLMDNPNAREIFNQSGYKGN